MSPRRLIILFTCLSALFDLPLSAQSIAEKKEGLISGSQDLTPELQNRLLQVNSDLRQQRAELYRLYAEAENLYAMEAPESSFQNLVYRIRQVRDTIERIEESWRINVSQHGLGGSEQYALWHQPETTLRELVIDFGSVDYVYLMTPEIASIKLSIDSNLPVPRASWNEMLEVLLAQNGIGYKQLNPFLRQLFLLQDDRSNIRLLTNRREDLYLFPSNARVGFVLTPEPLQMRRLYFFLEKFVNPQSMTLQSIGHEILIISPVGELLDLLKLYDFALTNQGDKEYKILPLSRVDAEEMSKVLAALFEQLTEEPPRMNTEAQRGGNRPAPAPPRRNSSGSSGAGLRIVALKNIAQAVFLIGTRDEIRRAEEIVKEVESRISGAKEKEIYTYKVRHSDPEELGKLLDKIYNLMSRSGTGMQKTSNNSTLVQGPGPGPGPGPGGPMPGGPVGPGGPMLPGAPPPPSAQGVGLQASEQNQNAATNTNIEVSIPPRPIPYTTPEQVYKDSFFMQGQGYIINPKPIQPAAPRKGGDINLRDNFIVDPKTNSIVMVVETDRLPKIKELLRKLDVPKKMVQIEVVLFEKSLEKETDFGLNLLRLGDCASGEHKTCGLFNKLRDSNSSDGTDALPGPLGLFDFILSRPETCCGFPAFDVIYRFLLGRDDISINASPSLVTLNQTKATIAIAEEISISTGIFDIPTTGASALKNSFTRAQYGTTIEITPTIHSMGDDPMLTEPDDYITLDTDITFDTIQAQGIAAAQARPNVIRRHLNNQVRIPDGQTVIIGGLRRKTSEDGRRSIPFIGEIPGIGKLFSFTSLKDRSTEMFIFITPKIISDPVEEFEIIKCEEMQRRPGDIPDFLCALNAARECEKRQALEGTLTMLFGKELDRCTPPPFSLLKGYDGRCTPVPCGPFTPCGP